MTCNLLFNLNILKRGFTSHVRDCKFIAHLRSSGLSIQSYGLTAPRRVRNTSQKRNNVCERNFKEFVDEYDDKKVDLLGYTVRISGRSTLFFY